jgi:hypothetical protein
MNSDKLHTPINYICLLLSILLSPVAYSQTRFIEKNIYHLRAGDGVEWKNFKGSPQKKLAIHFITKENRTEQTLGLRQEDVKQTWNVQLNGNVLGKLQEDENPLFTYFSIPPSSLKNGQNELVILQADTVADDIRVGAVILENRPLNELLHEATIEISVTLRNSNRLIPAHLTLLNSQRALQPMAVAPDPLLASRSGCIYTGTGKAIFSVPAGNYTLYAGRGFQYGVDSVNIQVKPGDWIKRSLQIEKELPLEGWLSCDTHIHTLTYSGHGDASMVERIITLAGEGIELPVITEHNYCADIDSLSRALNLRQYFTPVPGDEYTTPVGHFTIFPLNPDSLIPDYRANDWNAISGEIGGHSNRIIILNHAQDLHNNFRPFDPRRHIGVAGIELDGWKFPANSMEVMNSSSQQFDIMQLYRDWFGMMNGGNLLTPVGSSDSHDVSRYLVGQARTYIRYNGNDPANIDKTEVLHRLLAGEVMVSFGLIAEMSIDSIYGPGSIVPAAGQVKVSVKVLAPSWTEADSLFLFTNGKKIRSEKIKAKGAKGIKWQGVWTIPVSNQDMFLVAIATGPDPGKPFWPIPKPYQPTSTEWHPRLIGSSGAIWIDADGDGIRTTAHDYASRVLVRHPHDIAGLIRELAAYDEAVSVQAAALLQEQRSLPTADNLDKMLTNAAPVVKAGFALFLHAFIMSQSSY